ncbi:hypothetical protein ACXIT0_11995 [Methylorubrum extorquens]|uniref:hypothetical protein n=1 Tax=Methylorubrum extorquens TaxID=408 RepID=UPI0022391088|nr:hypothetical protein [Methylorubrum extorquens]UYW27724.1 hypothetical protein OKC48_04210 [Methylorubrum extorquens]
MATRADGDLKQVIDQSNRLERKTNIKGRVTLARNATQTVVTELQMGFTSAVALTPMTANAAAEIASGACFISAYGPGTFTITHRNLAQTDRTFSYLVAV